MHPRRSVLLVVVDTLRADHLGAYGSSAGHTPALDALASHSIVYDAAVSPAPFTMPAVAALMTGRYPDAVGVSNHTRRDHLAETAKPLAERARAAGYRTAAVVTNPWLANPATGFSRGFDVFTTGRNISSVGVPGARMTAAAVTDQALELLAALGSDQPSLIWVHYMDAHMPYQPPQTYAAELGVSSATSPIIEDFLDDTYDRQSIYFDAPYPHHVIEATRRLYAASVRSIDAQIGRLLAGLERTGRADDTIVVFLADHGESLGDHGLYFAHDFTLYDELIAIPLMLRIPGQPAARVSRTVSTIDVVPTLCRLTGVACEEPLDGEALPLTATDGDADRMVFAAGAPARARYDRNPWLTVARLPGRWTMIRQADHKLIRIPQPAAPAWELYDLSQDPHETTDIDQPAAAEPLRAALAAWTERMESQRPTSDQPQPHLGKPTRKALRELGYLD